MLIHICLISFFSLFKFSTFIFALNTGNLVNSLFGVEIFNPFPSFASYSPSTVSMEGTSSDSSNHVE